MKLLIFLFVFIQTTILIGNYFDARKNNQIFSLASILGLGCFLYITLPTAIFASLNHTIINGAIVPISFDPLIISSLFGLAFITLLKFLPVVNMAKENVDTLWAKIIFFILVLMNSYYFFKFLDCFDFSLALSMIDNHKVSYIRDLAYSTLGQVNISFGYVLGALQLAFFSFLWMQDEVSKKILLVGIFPLLAINLISLSRVGLASFVAIIFFCLEQKGKLNRRFWVPVIVVSLLFFLRPIIFYFTDDGYQSWMKFRFDPANKGLEFIGEFYNTFGTYMMVYHIEQARFNISEILTVLFSQIFIPPGLTNFFYNSIGETYPIFRISDLILKHYGAHPAHSSLVDFYTFGMVSIPFFLLYFLLVKSVSKNPSGISGVIYLYLLSVFFLPFRGSLTLSVIRIFWLLLGLIIFRYSFQKSILLIKRKFKL